MCWPNSFLRRNSMNFGPTTIVTTIASTPAARTRITGGSPGGYLGERGCHSFEPHRARGFHKHGIAGSDQLLHLPDGVVDVGDPASGDASVEVPPRELTYSQQLVDPELCRSLTDLAVIVRTGASKLGHVAEDRDA